MTVCRRIRIYTSEDVAEHNTHASCWVSRQGKIYDVSAFLPDHPGGDDLILKHAGKNIEDTMKDSGEHDHSDSAYDMLEEYVIGKLGSQESIVKDGATNYNILPC
jgi:4-hydroxysphinganine ceramide fatty acyl 2-hydroxylase